MSASKQAAGTAFQPASPENLQGYDKWHLSLYHLEIMALGIRTLPCLMKYFHFFNVIPQLL